VPLLGSIYWTHQGRHVETRPHKIVRLIYFDEAGTASEAQEPITVVASVIVHGDNQWGPIEDYLDWVRASIIPEPHRESFPGFHAKDLFSSGSSLTGVWGRTKRWEVFDAFLETFRRVELPVVWMGVERSLLKQKFAVAGVPIDAHDPSFPRDIAFCFCLQGVNAWFRSNAPEEKGICIAETTDWHAIKTMKAAVSTWRKQPAIKQMVETKLDHLIDAISFRDKHETFGTQLADAWLPD
jgi:Protein of unknown function (DUF3800)